MESAVEETASAPATETPAGTGEPASGRGDSDWLRDFARVSPVAIFHADREGSCTYASERWTALTGRSPEAALGQGWEQAVHPEDVERVRAAWRSSWQIQQPLRIELRYVRPGGEIVWVLSQTVEERDAAGRVCGFLSTVTDITEVRRMREELQLSHTALEERVAERTTQLEHMAMIVAASADAIVSSNLAGEIVSWNQAAELIFGYSAAEMLGQSSYRVTPPEKHAESADLKARVRRGERIRHLETVRVARSGELIEVALSLYPLRDAAGEIIGTSAILRDIREQKKAERRLRQLSGRLLRVQDEERRRLARELHDSTAQSLAALSIHLSQLNKTPSPLAEEKRAVLLADSLALAESIGRELRTHAYLLHPPLLDERGLPAALRWLVEGFSARSGIAVDLEITPDLARLPDAVELAIFRVVQESLTNVHRHAKSATAEIRLRQTAEEITLTVRDAGSGLAGEGAELFGVGIAGMRERLVPLGGTLTIETQSPGTLVTASLPRP